MVLNPIVEQLGWDESHIKDLRFMGYSLYVQGKYQQASLYFETLIRLEPESVYDYQILGALYLECNENEMALDMIEKALALDASDLLTKLNKVKALVMLDRKNEGLQLAKELMKCRDKGIANIAEALLLGHS